MPHTPRLCPTLGETTQICTQIKEEGGGGEGEIHVASEGWLLGPDKTAAPNTGHVPNLGKGCTSREQSPFFYIWLSGLL